LRYIASTCGDDALKQKIENALAEIRPENGREQ